MADTVSTQVIRDDFKKFTIKLTNKSDGTGLTANTVIDASTLTAANNNGTERFTITKAFFTIRSAGGVELIWGGQGGGANNATAMILAGNGTWDMVNDLSAPITNNATSPTGDLLLSTRNFAANDAYTIILEGHKLAGYTSREVTD